VHAAVRGWFATTVGPEVSCSASHHLRWKRQRQERSAVPPIHGPFTRASPLQGANAATVTWSGPGIDGSSLVSNLAKPRGPSVWMWFPSARPVMTIYLAVFLLQFATIVRAAAGAKAAV